MQYKVILIASALLLSFGAIQAQPDPGNIEDSVTTLPKGVRSVSAPLASNTLTGDKEELTALSEREMEDQDLLVHGTFAKKYKPVPLAGQKAYFGDMNDYMMDFVRKYFEAHNQSLSIMQARAIVQFPLIDNILKKNHIPKELKYLAVIESALNNNAVSPVGAVGPWQFMRGTARNMGINPSGRDDRRDWYKSTTAAAKYISLLYGKFNDWLLVVAAYNCGPVPVQRAIERTGSNNFWSIKSHLPLETQGHVLKFIATATIFEQLDRFIGLGTLPSDFKFGEDTGPAAQIAAAKAKTAAANKKAALAGVAPIKNVPNYTHEELMNMTIVRITDPLSMDIVAQELSIDKSLLARWNSDYDLFLMKAYPTEYYKLRIPKDKLDQFVEKKERLTKRSAQMFSDLIM